MALAESIIPEQAARKQGLVRAGDADCRPVPGKQTRPGANQEGGGG